MNDLDLCLEVVSRSCQPLRHILLLLLLLLVWQAPLGVRSAKRRHQSPEWTIISHSYRLIQWEIVWSQILLDSLHPRSSRTSWWFPPVLRRRSSYDTPGICLVWRSCNMANRERRRAWTIADRRGCPIASHSTLNISETATDRPRG